MMIEVGLEEEMKVAHCDFCESESVVLGSGVEEFVYGDGVGAVTLSVNVPTISCVECGLVSAVGDAERLRAAAVSDHLGVLRAEEIRAIRRQYGFSRDVFAKVTGIGEASIQRWESAKGFPNKAFSNFLMLLVRKKENMEILLGGVDRGGDDPDDMQGRFPHLSLNEDVISQSMSFELR